MSMSSDTKGFRLFLGAGLLAAALAVNSVKGDEFLYVSPTTSIVSIADSYVYPTSSIVSTTYVEPRDYVSATSAYIVPTSTVYATDVIVPRAYWRRARRSSLYATPTYYLATTSRVSPTYYLAPVSSVSSTYYLPSRTSLAPTYYLSPTRYLTATSYSSSGCDETTQPMLMPRPLGTRSTVAPNGGQEDRVERRPTGEADSTANVNPTDPEATRTAKPQSSITSEPAGGPLRGLGNAGTGNGSSTGSATGSITNPPANPVPATGNSSRTPPNPGTGTGLGATGTDPYPAGVPPLGSGATSKTATPEKSATKPIPAVPSTPPAPTEPESNIAPLPDIPPPMGAPGSTRRDSYRPVVKDSDVTALRASRNVLKGRVLSSETGAIEEGVAVILSDRLKRFADRSAKTDAFGRFAVSLPEGDWTVKVTMPSGNVYIVGDGDVTASSGKILDDTGREVGLFTIRR